MPIKFQKASILFLGILLILASPSHSQPETIASDRPGNANTAVAVGQRVFQVQSGFDFNRTEFYFKIPNNVDPAPITTKPFIHEFSFANVFRYGILKKTEINAEFNISSTEDSFDDRFNEEPSGISKIGLGIRQQVLQESNNIPAIGILGTAYFNGLLNDYGGANPDGRLMLLAQKQLFKFLTITGNFGYSFDQEFKVDEFDYTLNLSTSITPIISTYIEIYGPIDGSDFDLTFADTGIGFLINDNLQLDLYGGVNINRPDFNFYVKDSYWNFFGSTGISYRFM